MENKVQAPAKKPYNKYGNEKVTHDGINFDSKVEGNYYLKLKKDKQLGKIVSFVPNISQPKMPPYELLPSYQLPGERKQAAIKYIPDFIVNYGKGVMKIIDIKGGDTTPEFKLKKKMFESKHKKKIWEVRWDKNLGDWVEK